MALIGATHISSLHVLFLYRLWMFGYPRNRGIFWTSFWTPASNWCGETRQRFLLYLPTYVVSLHCKRRRFEEAQLWSLCLDQERRSKVWRLYCITTVRGKESLRFVGKWKIYRKNLDEALNWKYLSTLSKEMFIIITLSGIVAHFVFNPAEISQWK